MTKSKQPRKQRKKIHTQPAHKRRKQIKTTLKKELRKTTNKRSITIRKGDKAKVMRGKHKGKEGKVTHVDYKTYRVGLEKITRKKPDGKEIPIMIATSNLMITELNTSDQKRRLKKAKIIEG